MVSRPRSCDALLLQRRPRSTGCLDMHCNWHGGRRRGRATKVAECRARKLIAPRHFGVAARLCVATASLSCCMAAGIDGRCKRAQRRRVGGRGASAVHGTLPATQQTGVHADVYSCASRSAGVFAAQFASYSSSDDAVVAEERWRQLHPHRTASDAANRCARKCVFLRLALCGCVCSAAC